jgi:predicted phosphodiesterase
MLTLAKRSILTLATVCIASSSHLCAATFTVRPYLIYPDHIEQMTLLWQTDSKPKNTTVEWGETQSYGKKASDVTPFGKEQFKYNITGLTPDTRYFYKVTVDGEEKTGFFKSAPRPEKKIVTFYALGDTRFGLSKTQKTDPLAAVMLKDINQSLDNNTFCLHGGDWGGFQGDFFSEKQVNLQQITSRLPIMGCCGNHDGKSFGEYYPYKDTDINGTGNHTFEYGPVFVVCCRTTDPSSKHGQWIAEELKKSKKKLKIVVMHHPGWSAYAKKNKGSTRAMQTMFEENGVSLVITGHAHVYSRSMVNGMPHITFGSGSPTREVNTELPNVVVAEAGYHYLRVDVFESYVKTTTTRLDGSQVETFKFDYPVVPTVSTTTQTGSDSTDSKKPKKKKKQK